MFIPIALLVNPMVAVTGTIATPDAPACFFQAAALVTALEIFDGRAKTRLLWLRFGLLMGLALDSKYPSVLLGVAIALAMIFSREGRRHLATPWPWMAALVAALVFSPVIYWNATHHWASFRFQLHHGTAGTGSPAWKNELDYVGGQLGVASPVLFIACIWVLIVYWRRKDISMPVRILLYAATTPLVFFAISATRRRVEANWPMFAYFPAVLLYAKYLAERWHRRRLMWAELAIVVAACMTLVLHAPTLVWEKFPNLGAAQWDHLYLWRQLAQTEVDPLRIDSPIFTGDYEYASELSFYLPPGAVVRPLPDPGRPTAFDFFPGFPSPDSSDRVLLVRRLPKGYDSAPLWQPLGPGYDYPAIKTVSQNQGRRQIRRSLIEVARRKS
jgi:4-amino-4-deoxy-L-arabinose transferase-like glycosyltransferase